MKCCNNCKLAYNSQRNCNIVGYKNNNLWSLSKDYCNFWELEKIENNEIGKINEYWDDLPDPYANKRKICHIICKLNELVEVVNEINRDKD